MSALAARRVIILGALPRRRAWRAALGREPGRVISISPALSDALVDAGVAHRSSERYFAAADWSAIHDRVAVQLRRMAAGSEAIARSPWLDDWSHLLGDELRDTLYWMRVAEQVLRRERPHQVCVQRLASAHPASPALAALRAAFAQFGHPCRPWPPAR